MMTKKELIAALEDVPDETIVACMDDTSGYWGHIQDVLYDFNGTCSIVFATFNDE
jgi:hypothetical protein